MYPEHINTPLQIRFLHDDPPVKPPRTQQRLIENFRPVRRAEDHDPFGRIKTVHLREKLVQRLLPLVIPASVLGITALADRVDLIDKNDTRRHRLRLLKQIPHTGGPDADKHFHKIRTRQGEKRNICLSCQRLCQQRFSRSRRADQQRALWQLRADLPVLIRVLQKVDQFRQRFFRFLFSRHIFKRNAGFLLYVHFRRRFSHSHNTAAAIFCHHAHEQPQNDPHTDKRQNVSQEKFQNP